MEVAAASNTMIGFLFHLESLKNNEEKLQAIGGLNLTFKRFKGKHQSRYNIIHCFR